MQVSCGARHSAIITSDSRAFACGCNKHRELGEGVDEVNVSTFASLMNQNAIRDAVNSRGKLKDLECGWWHTALLF